MSRRTTLLTTAFGSVAALAATAAVWAFAREIPTPVAAVRVVAEHPHDAAAFTQGLVVRDGVLYESTGLLGQSTLRKVDLATGRAEVLVPFDPTVFGEGLTAIGDEIFVVTWQNKLGYVFDRATLRYKRTFRYGGEGWGLTDDGTHLILSDGTATLRFLDPKDARVVRRLTVRDGGRAVENLNELEYVAGEIYANVWYEDRIARVSPETGRVVGWIDASPLRRRVALADPREDVLNGIAYDRDAKKLYLTGKRWPKLFEVEVAK